MASLILRLLEHFFKIKVVGVLFIVLVLLSVYVLLHLVDVVLNSICDCCYLYVWFRLCRFRLRSNVRILNGAIWSSIVVC